MRIQHTARQGFLKLPGPVRFWTLIFISAVLAVLVIDTFFRNPHPHNHQESIKGFHRSLATALESYRVDHGSYPPDIRLTTTPIAYIVSVIYMEESPFLEGSFTSRYWTEDGNWFISADGPDGVFQFRPNTPPDLWIDTIYDVTNGTDSSGDIIRTNHGILEPRIFARFHEIQNGDTLTTNVP